MIYLLIATAAAVALTLTLQGLIMAKLDSVSAQLDALTSALNDETNAIAARLDAFEIAVGSTVTQAQVDHLRAISDRLKSLGADPAVPVPPVPAAEAATRLEVAAVAAAGSTPVAVEEVTQPVLVPLRPSQAPKGDK